MLEVWEFLTSIGLEAVLEGGVNLLKFISVKCDVILLLAIHVVLILVMKKNK